MAQSAAPSSIRVAAVQWEPVKGDVSANWAIATGFLAKLAPQNPDLVVLPEMALTGYIWRKKSQIEPLARLCSGESVQQQWVEASQAHNVWLVVGHPAVDADSGSLRNRCTLVSPEGIVGHYDKTCLFPEDRYWAEAGDLEPPVWATPWGAISPVICADTDYPEPVASAVGRGAQLMVFPTAWVDEPAPSATWTLRAAEYAVPFVTADIIGVDSGVVFAGGSCIISRDGTILSALDYDTGTVVADIALADAIPSGVTTRRTIRIHDGGATGKPKKRDLTVAVYSGDQSVLEHDLSQIPQADVLVLPSFLAGGDKARSDIEKTLSSWSGEKDALVAACIVDGSSLSAEVVTTHRGGPMEVVAQAGRSVDSPWGDKESVTEATVLTLGGVTVGVMGAWGLADHRPLRALAAHGAHLVLATGPATLSPSRMRTTTEAPFAGGMGDEEQWFAHPGRFRAGESNVWLALASDDPANPSGVFSPNHVWWPRRETLAASAGWVTSTITVNTRDRWGSEAVVKPLLGNRRQDLYVDDWETVV